MTPPERGYARFEPRVPLYVSAFGPRTMAVAGRYGDGILSYLGGTPEMVASAWEPLEAGAAAAGRDLDRRKFFTSSMMMICVLRDGEDVESPRIRAQAAPVAMLTVHYCYEQFKQLGTPPPPFLEGIWEEYVATVEAVPLERRGLRIHRGHGEWVPDEDQRFVTSELLLSTCAIGTGAEIAAQLRSLRTADLDEVAVNPSPETARELIDDIANHVLPLL
jgi:5,10-methylenetetrahydromethanopterin reductase